MIDRTTLLESMPTELWLGGLQVPASTGARFAVHDPATDAVLIEVVLSMLGDEEKSAVLAEAQAVGANAREASADLGALRAEVEANLRKIDTLLNQVNRTWPFARDPKDLELTLP